MEQGVDEIEQRVKAQKRRRKNVEPKTQPDVGNNTDVLGHLHDPRSARSSPGSGVSDDAANLSRLGH